MSAQTSLKPAGQIQLALTPSANHPAMEPFVEQAGQLYTLPTVAVEILQLTSQPKADLALLKQCLLRDPALVGKILRVVNSSLFGLSREVGDLNQALALLGTKSLRLLVLGFSLPDELFVGLAGHVLQRYWHHTAIKAAAAREISEAIFHIPGEEPFIAGLLQDLGMLVLLQQIGEPYVKFLERAFANGVDIGNAETVALGFDHVQLTAQLLTRWGLPENLVAAIGAGGSTERIAKVSVAGRELAQILHLADLLAGMLMEGRADWLGRLLHVGQQYHQLTGEQLTEVVNSLQGKVQQLAEVLSLELPEGIDYATLYQQAHRSLSAVAEEAAIELSKSQGPSGDWQKNANRSNEASLESETNRLIEAVRRFTHSTHRQLKPTTVRPKQTNLATSLLQPELSAATASNTQNPISAAAQPASKANELPESHGLMVIQAESSSSAASASMDTDNNLLLPHVGRWLAACREAREPLSLILVEVDRYRPHGTQHDPIDPQHFMQLVGLVCGKVDHPQATQMSATENRLALILPNCDRPAARAFGHLVLDEVRKLCGRSPELSRVKLSVSVGVATVAMPAKNFPPQNLIASADRCLHAAQLSGGNGVKSIDVL